jgi:hypothetical protein
VLTRAAAALAIAVIGCGRRRLGEAKRADLDGVWILAKSADIAGLKLTPAGEAAKAKYDHVKDDPDMRCIPRPSRA